MDFVSAFDRRVSEGAVAEVLQRIGSPPNRREQPIPGDVQGEFDFWFDGGACKIHTGSVAYEFTNGACATVAAPVPTLMVEIQFADGCRVRVQQSP